MTESLQYQLRVYLDDERAARARVDRRSPLLAPLTAVLDRHDAALVCQLDAFEDYVAKAERAGALNDPLYKWTKVTIQDPAMRAKHGTSFAIRVAGQEVYAKPLADALESDLKPMVGGDIVRSMSRHDTDPEKNIPIPAKYRERQNP